MTQLFSDGARGELAALINSTDTTIIIVEGGNLFPTTTSGDWFNLVLQDDTGIEVIQCHGHEGGSNTFTDIIRGSGSREFAAGSVVGLRLVANDIANIKYDITQKADDLQTLNDEVAEGLLPAGNSLIKPILQKVRNNLKSLFTSVDSLTTTVGDKVDKVAGKSLSTNDYTTVEKTKLSGITAGATVNNTDEYLLNRSNHTGSQPISSVTDLPAMLDSIANAISQSSQVFTDGVSFQKGIELVANASTTLSAGSTKNKRCITMTTDIASFGGPYDDHSAFMMYPHMPGGWTSGEMRIATANGHGSYNTATPALRVAQSGLYIAGDVFCRYASDPRLKENFKPIDDALGIVNKVTGYTFRWKDREAGDDYYKPVDDFGFNAAEFQVAFPMAVKPREDGTLTVDYIKAVAIAFQAINELTKRVQELEAKV